jgi:hypothetical protein
MFLYALGYSYTYWNKYIWTCVRNGLVLELLNVSFLFKKRHTSDVHIGQFLITWPTGHSTTWRMSSSGMWRCVDPGLTDVSEESITSIFRVEKSWILHIVFYQERQIPSLISKAKFQLSLLRLDLSSLLPLLHFVYIQARRHFICGYSITTSLV